MPGYSTYILYSESFDKYYIGQTGDIANRLEQHNGKDKRFPGYTKLYRPWKLVYEESFETRSEAVKLERYLKKLRNKERIKQYIAGWRSSISQGP